jgi:hypothetical protein
MANSKNLYQQTVDISSEYLGPSAERFISRQITNHLKKDPEKLNKRDIPRLAEWVRITFSLLTDDQELIESFDNDLRSLTSASSTVTRVSNAQS